MDEVPETATVGFWRNWPLPKVLVFAALVVAPLPLGLGQYSAFPGLAFYLFVWNWISHDSRRHPGILSKYGGFAFFVFWPLFIPFYLIETRGWKRTSAALFAVLVLFVATGLLADAILFGL